MPKRLPAPETFLPAKFSQNVTSVTTLYIEDVLQNMAL